MKRPALQKKLVVVLRMAFRARKVLGTFEKRAPGPEMVTLTVIKKWTELKNLGNGFLPFFFLL